MPEIYSQSIPETVVEPCNFRVAIWESGKSPVAKVAARPIEMQPIITRAMSNAFKGVPVKRWPITRIEGICSIQLPLRCGFPIDPRFAITNI